MKLRFWMRYTVRCPDGKYLHRGDEVEWFHTRYHRWRFKPADIESALITLRQLAGRAGDQKWLQPVVVIHCGRLHVIERRYLASRPAAPPTRPPAPELSKPRRQRELFE